MTDKQLAVVEWWDAWVSEEPVSTDMAASLHKPELVTTIGWVLFENDLGIQLSNEFYNATHRGRTFIPKAMIKAVTPCKLTRPRKKKAP